MKTFLWIVLVTLNILLVLALLNAIGYTMRRRLLKHMLSFRSFRRKLEIHTATCGAENDPYSGYSKDEHIKQLQLTILVNRCGGESTYKAELFCPLHNHTERFDMTKAEFKAVSKIINGKEWKKS